MDTQELRDDVADTLRSMAQGFHDIAAITADIEMGQMSACLMTLAGAVRYGAIFRLSPIMEKFNNEELERQEASRKARIESN